MTVALESVAPCDMPSRPYWMVASSISAPLEAMATSRSKLVVERADTVSPETWPPRTTNDERLVVPETTMPEASPPHMKR